MCAEIGRSLQSVLAGPTVHEERENDNKVWNFDGSGADVALKIDFSFVSVGCTVFV